VPIPADADTPVFQASSGKASYDAGASCFVWKLKQCPGKEEYTLRAEFGFPSSREDGDEEATQSAKPVEVNFSVPYFCVSGLQIRYLKVHEQVLGYRAMPWVRYLTSGSLISRR
ncbi:hypothetical protein KIPB_012417, partial [Kipferlia bialata]